MSKRIAQMYRDEWIATYIFNITEWIPFQWTKRNITLGMTSTPLPPLRPIVNYNDNLCLLFNLTIRMHLHESFFETLPPTIDDTRANYATPCTCTIEGPHCGQNPINIPSFLRDKTTAFNLCDRAFKRDIHYSDDLTDEDYELLRKPLQPHHHHRFKRAIPAPVVSKENATRYCADKIAETEVGKLCAEVGVNVQAYVNSCSVDIEVC